MPILEARIETERPSRYLVQFCKHAAAMGGGGHSPRMHLHGRPAAREVRIQAQWTDTHGTVTFIPWGRCTIEADTDTLTVRIDATNDETLHQIQDVITRDLDRFSRRSPLTVTWHRQEAPDVPPPPAAGDDPPPAQPPPAQPPPAQPPPAQPRRAVAWARANLQTAGIVVAVLLVVALHLGLAGTLVADSRWTALATNAVLALVALKIALIALLRRRAHRRRPIDTPDEAATQNPE